MSQVNEAPLETWYSVPDWSPTELHHEAPEGESNSLRNIGVEPYKKREINSRWILARPGSRVVFTAKIKTGLKTKEPRYPHIGARIGIDFYAGSKTPEHPTGQLGGIAWDMQGAEPNVTPSPETVANGFVPYGEEWTLRKIDVKIPEVLDGDKPAGVIAWFQVYSGRDINGKIINELTPCWLGQPELYVYPDGIVPEPSPEPGPEPPTPEPTPTPQPTYAARTIGPLGIPSALLREMWKLREKTIRPEVHKKTHPLI